MRPMDYMQKGKGGKRGQKLGLVLDPTKDKQMEGLRNQVVMLQDIINKGQGEQETPATPTLGGGEK